MVAQKYNFYRFGFQCFSYNIVCLFVVPLHLHLEKHSVEYLQFAFRWMNNLLMREIPLRCTIRLWDTYQVREAVILFTPWLPKLKLECSVGVSQQAVGFLFCFFVNGHDRSKNHREKIKYL